MDNLARVHCFFSGHVQGVGFRYTVSNLAPEFKATGWVRNLPDGRVEMVAEGERNNIQGLIQKIEAVMGSFVRETSATWAPFTGAWNTFSIKF